MKRMGVTAWQRQLLSTLTRLDGSVARLEGTVVRLDESVTRLDGAVLRLEEGQREMREDIRSLTGDMRTLTRVVVRRFGTAGSASPQVGDHVLYHLRPEAILPAVVIAADEGRLDLEVFGTEVTTPNRFPKNVPQGIAPGCWSFPA